MNMRTVNVHEAKTQLSRLLKRVASGEEIVIARDGRPCARLVPLSSTEPKRQAGTLKGLVGLNAGFFDPLPAGWTGED
jgi:prevent-host-death family protein